jgi:hypothetical protein
MRLMRSVGREKILGIERDEIPDVETHCFPFSPQKQTVGGIVYWESRSSFPTRVGASLASRFPRRFEGTAAAIALGKEEAALKRNVGSAKSRGICRERLPALGVKVKHCRIPISLIQQFDTVCRASTSPTMSSCLFSFCCEGASPIGSGCGTAKAIAWGIEDNALKRSAGNARILGGESDEPALQTSPPLSKSRKQHFHVPSTRLGVQSWRLSRPPESVVRRPRLFNSMEVVLVPQLAAIFPGIAETYLMTRRWILERGGEDERTLGQGNIQRYPQPHHCSSALSSRTAAVDVNSKEDAVSCVGELAASGKSGVFGFWATSWRTMDRQ